MVSGFVGGSKSRPDAPAPADASGLLLLPPTKPLTNRYVLVRAGESRSEADGVIETNAARKFLFSNGLTEEGAKQASAAADAVARVFGDASGPPVVRYATARHCKQTADILGARLAVPSSKLLPEADLLDARGYGAHEGEGLWRVPELWAQYDAKSRYAKPPEAEDGSYAESVEDVYVRVREVLSVCETTLCDDVVLVAPGSDVLSVLEASSSTSFATTCCASRSWRGRLSLTSFFFAAASSGAQRWYSESSAGSPVFTLHFILGVRSPCRATISTASSSSPDTPSARGDGAFGIADERRRTAVLRSSTSSVSPDAATSSCRRSQISRKRAGRSEAMQMV